MKNELQQHKKSDSIKWIVVFILIAILTISMAGFIVKMTTERHAEGSTDSGALTYKDTNAVTENLEMEYLDLSDMAVCISLSGKETLQIKQSGVINAPNMDISLCSLDEFFQKDIFENEYFYANSMLSFDNFRFVFEKDGEYRVHDVCLDSIYYTASYEYDYLGEDGTEYKDVCRMLKINYFFDKSGDGNNDVRYDTITIISFLDSTNPENKDSIGSYIWNIYSELSQYTTSNGYEFVGIYFTEEASTINCFIYNSAKGE